MPLLDHFHAPDPLFPPWESFHTVWATTIMERLNSALPRRYLAVVSTHLGSQVEADVAEWERNGGETEDPSSNGPGGGVAVQPWAPPVATMVMPAIFPDALEVRIHENRGGVRLVAVVELISPGNKDRPESRHAFAAKCSAYLQRGVGLVIVDVVTERHANLHNELVRLMELPETFALAEPSLYTVAYRPTRRQERNEIDVWPAALTVNGALPVLPLGLLGGPVVPVDLEATYMLARQRSRV